MGNLIRWLLAPLVRLIVGVLAAPLMRVCLRHAAPGEKLNRELAKDLEQWVRGSLLLLVATANMEDALFGWVPLNLQENHAWVVLGFRLLLAISVVEAMPDQDLFPIIHPGPARLRLPPGRRLAALRAQLWPFCVGLLCRHLDRSSFVLAILAVLKTGAWGWACYVLAIVQFLIIGLVSSTDKALDVLSEFDRQVQLRRDDLRQRRLPPDLVHSIAVAEPHAPEESRPAPPGAGENK